MIMDDNDDNPQKNINGSRIPCTTFVTFATIKRGFEHYVSRSTLSSALTNGKFPKDMFPENVKSTFGLGFATGMTFMDIIWFLYNDISGIWRGEKKIKTQPDPDQLKAGAAPWRWALPAGPRKRLKHCRCRESLECVDLEAPFQQNQSSCSRQTAPF